MNISNLISHRMLVIVQLIYWQLFVSAYSNNVIQGYVELRSGCTRLQRPSAPKRATGPAFSYAKSTNNCGHLVSKKVSDIFNAKDFILQLSTGSPGKEDVGNLDNKTDDTEEVLSGNVTSEESLIAWEAWHHRVAQAIYTRWLAASEAPGVAMVTLTISRHKTITADVKDYSCPASIMQIFMSKDRLEELFTKSIQEAVSGLNGKEILEFPERSERQTMVLDAVFKLGATGGTGGYSWKKDDFERVTLR